MKLVRGGILFIALVAAVGADCCDPAHDQLMDQGKQAEKDMQLCRDRGGVPIYSTQHDDGGHSFSKLERCDFPPVTRLSGEKGQ